MYECEWQATFIVEPGLQEPETVSGFGFQIQDDGKTIVQRSYKTSSVREKCPQCRGYNEYAEETFARLDAKAIRDIMLRRMIYQKHFFAISVTLKESLILRNRQQLLDAGVDLLREYEYCHSAPMPILDVGSSLAESQTFWDDRFRNRKADRQSDLLRIADWIERSYAEQDEIKGFILIWIAFNGLYGLFDEIYDNESRNDSEKIALLVRELVNISDANRIIQNIQRYASRLASLHLLSQSRGTNYSEKLKEALIKPDEERTRLIELILRCIYAIRKQVFHEAPATDDILERVKVAKLALVPIVVTCLKAYVAQ